MRRSARMLTLAAVPLVLFAFTAPAVSATAAPAEGGAGGAALQRKFEGVWYRTPDKRGKIAAFLASGDLTLGGETISFQSEKVGLSIASAGVRNVVEGWQFPDDPANVWIVVEYEEGGSRKAAAFKNAGMGRGTAEISNAIFSTWLAGEPPPASAPTESEIAAATDVLHTKRLESYGYDNASVPKHVWKLVFTPGLDDALVRAYRAGDSDDVYRFNLVMILNRRTVDIQEDDVRQRVHDCLTEAVKKDGFDWVRGEALDGLRRLAGKKQDLEALSLVMDGESDAESRMGLLTWYAGWKKAPALYVAAQMGRDDAVGSLLEKGAAIDETAGAAGPGWSPLMIAAAEGKESTVKLLLGKGANPNAVNDLGRTALMFASAYGYTPIVVALLTRDANPNAAPKDDTGWTALIAAAAKGHRETVEALLKGGADPSLKDKKGFTARDHAKEAGHSRVAKLLE